MKNHHSSFGVEPGAGGRPHTEISKEEIQFQLQGIHHGESFVFLHPDPALQAKEGRQISQVELQCLIECCFQGNAADILKFIDHHLADQVSDLLPQTIHKVRFIVSGQDLRISWMGTKAVQGIERQAPQPHRVIPITEHSDGFLFSRGDDEPAGNLSGQFLPLGWCRIPPQRQKGVQFFAGKAPEFDQ